MTIPTSVTHCAMLCIGSNTGDRAAALARAAEAVSSWGTEASASEVYETPDITGCGAPYFNMVIRLLTTLSVAELEKRSKQLEAEAGRTPASKKKAAVELDVDVVEFDSDIIRPVDYSREYYRRGAVQLISDF